MVVSKVLARLLCADLFSFDVKLAKLAQVIKKKMIKFHSLFGLVKCIFVSVDLR